MRIKYVLVQFNAVSDTLKNSRVLDEGEFKFITRSKHHDIAWVFSIVAFEDNPVWGEIMNIFADQNSFRDQATEQMVRDDRVLVSYAMVRLNSVQSVVEVEIHVFLH